MKTADEIEQELKMKERRVAYWESHHIVPDIVELETPVQQDAGFVLADFYDYSIDQRGFVNFNRILTQQK